MSGFSVGELMMDSRTSLIDALGVAYKKEKPCVPGIKNVIFHDPATIVWWEDGTKTVVKADKEKYDPEKGLTMAISKKALGNQGNYYEVIKKWVGDLMPGCKDVAEKNDKSEKAVDKKSKKNVKSKNKK